MAQSTVPTITFSKINGGFQITPFVLGISPNDTQVQFMNLTDIDVIVIIPNSNFFQNKLRPRKFTVSPNNSNGVTKSLVSGLHIGSQTTYAYIFGNGKVGGGDNQDGGDPPTIIIKESGI